MENRDEVKKGEHHRAAWTQYLDESRRLFLGGLLAAALLLGTAVGRGLWKEIRKKREEVQNKPTKVKRSLFFKKIKKLSLDDLRKSHDLAG